MLWYAIRKRIKRRTRSGDSASAIHATRRIPVKRRRARWPATHRVPRVPKLDASAGNDREQIYYRPERRAAPWPANTCRLASRVSPADGSRRCPSRCSPYALAEIPMPSAPANDVPARGTALRSTRRAAETSARSLRDDTRTPNGASTTAKTHPTKPYPYRTARVPAG